jgi:antitoxin YefM
MSHVSVGSTRAVTTLATHTRILHMKTTSLADVRTQLSRYVEDVATTHERVIITKNGKPAAVLISAEDLEALEETLFWARQDRVSEEGPTVGVEVVAAELAARRSRDEE